jgi:hypothetical protein
MTYAMYSASVLVRFSWPQVKVMGPLLLFLLSLRGSSLVDTSELKIPLLMSSRLSVGSNVTSSLNSMSQPSLHRLLLPVFDLLRPWLLLLMCYYPIRVSKVCEALCGLAYSHCAR